MRNFSVEFSGCCLALVLRSAVAGAQVPGGTSTELPGSGSSAAALPGSGETAPIAEAELLTERAKQLFREARFSEAVPLLERAYALTRAPRQLFNLGVLHHKLSECNPAREYFERYLTEDPEGTARADAQRALEELYAHCPAPDLVPSLPAASPEGFDTSALPERTVAEAPQPARAPVPARDWAGRSSGPGAPALVLLGSGAAAGVAALLSVGMQNRAQHNLDALRTRASAGGTWDAYEPERRALDSDAHLYHGLSIAFGLGFAALAGTGGALWVWNAEPQDSIEVSVEGHQLRCAGRF